MEEKWGNELKNFVDRKITELGTELQQLEKVSAPNETQKTLYSFGKLTNPLKKLILF